MAQRDVDANSVVLITWTEPSFSHDAHDDWGDLPDSDLTDGIDNNNSYTDGMLVEIPPESGFGILNSQEIIRNRMQTDHQIPPPHRPGQRGGVADFSVRAIGADSSLADTEVPDGGPLESLVDAAYGLPLSTTCVADVPTAGTADTVTLGAVTGWVKGLLFTFEDDTGATKDIRQAMDVTTLTITANRAFTDTPAATGDLVRPMRTWAPHARPIDHPTLFIARAALDAGSNDGMLMYFSGVGLVMTFECGTIGDEPMMHFTGIADDWKSAAAQAIDVSDSILTDNPPLYGLNSQFIVGGTELEVDAVSIDPLIDVIPRNAIGGVQGRATVRHPAQEGGQAGCRWVVDTPFDETHDADLQDATLTNIEFIVGPNGQTTVLDDYGYFVAFSPQVQLTAVEVVKKENLVYHRLTYDAVRHATAAYSDMYPLYFGIPGIMA